MGTMTQSYPRGYWSSVFDKAAYLMNQREGLSGETAYWLARRLVDRGQGLILAGLSPHLHEVLSLAGFEGIFEFE